MDTRDMKLRCLAERDGSLWRGYCVDLGLDTQADSADEVKAKLHDMIEDYLLDVQRAINNGDRELAHQMLTRKAPLTVHLRYQRAVLLGWLGGGDKPERSQRYNEHKQVPTTELR